MSKDDRVEKGYGLPEGIDPEHEYVYRSGSHGIYDFWYVDHIGNYWKYTNAPQDSPDFDPYGGEALLVDDQPMPHTAPQFYADDGRKLHMAVPQGMDRTLNEAYDPLNSRSIWYALYQSEEGEPRFVYYDQDVRENLDLWVQYMLRVTDAGLVPYRQFASKLFESPHPKDRVIGAMLMLVDQGGFQAIELTNATVGDVEFTDFTVKLLGRKLVCDPGLVDFFTAATAGRPPEDPLFLLPTIHGDNGVGPRHLLSIFKALKMSPDFLLCWHATHLFSRILHRLAMEDVPVEEVEEQAMAELGRTLNIAEDPTFLVDFKTKEILLTNYVPEPTFDAEAAVNEYKGGGAEEQVEEPVEKALVRVSSDDLGVATVWSDLTGRRPDEQEFSHWLHSTPLHDTSPEEVQMVEEQLDQESQQDGELGPEIGDEGAVKSPEMSGTAPGPEEGDLQSAGDAE